MDEHEERQVGQEVQEVQGRKALQLVQGGGLPLQPDPTGPQLQLKLRGADEAPTSAGASWLLIQEKQEELLRESGQHIVKNKKTKQKKVDARPPLQRRVLLLGGSFRLPPPSFQPFECTCLHS